MSSYSDFDRSSIERDFGFTAEEIEEYAGHYHNIVDELKEEVDPDQPEQIPLDLDYDLQTVLTQTVDYDYLVMLIQRHVPAQDEPDIPVSAADKEEIDSYIDDLAQENGKLAGIVRGIWKELLKDRERYRDQQMSVVLKKEIDRRLGAEVEEFISQWGVAPEDMGYVIDHYSESRGDNQVGMELLINNSDKRTYEETVGETLSPLKFRSRLRKALREFIGAEVMPLRLR